MMDPNKGGGLGSIFMLLTLLVGGVALESQIALKASRPVNKNQIHYNRLVDENVDARLWEDPFEAVYQYQKRVKPTDTKISLWKTLLGKIKSESSGTVTLLGVLVSSGPYFVNAENRRRTRYAVLSGLASSGYLPENSEYIGYLKGGDSSFQQNPKGPKVVRSFLPPVLPYEWFLRKKNDRLLVLWLDDYHFFQKRGNAKNSGSGALGQIQILFSNLQRSAPEQSMQYRLIGPTGSTHLMEMVKNVGKAKGKANAAVPVLEIYSPRATKDETKILKLAPSLEPTNKSSSNAKIGKTSGEITSIHQLFKKRSNQIRFLRTTPTDYHLALALVAELKLRGVNFASDIALISEWDTDYGRAFQKTICKAWGERFVQASPKASEEDPCAGLKNIHYFSYLRGLDGEMPESPGSSAAKSKSSKPSDSSKKESVDLTSLRAEKERQYDYLLRLAEEIEEIQKSLPTNQKLWKPEMFQNPRFEAFGILGSDYYDKLVVLQALRKKFEQARFFTTDMDARLFHPDDFRHVRNLLVGSGFGLSLWDKLQKHIPPFRDTYQTSAYLATLLALESEACKKNLNQGTLDEWLEARVFEIGRTQAFDLSFKQKPIEKSPEFNCFKNFNIPVNTAFSLHPEPATVIQPYKYPAVIVLMLALIFFLCLQFKKYWPWVLTGVLILTGYMILLFYLNTQWDEEPIALLEGVSIWPTDFLRLIGVFVAMTVIGLYNGNPFSSASKGRLEENWNRMREDFKYSDVSPSDKWVPNSKKELWKKVGWRAAVFVGFGLLLLNTFGFPFVPFRGVITERVDILILAGFIVSFAVSLYYSGVHLNESIALLKSFKEKALQWPDLVKRKFFAEAIPQAADSKPSNSPDLPDSMKALLNGPVSLRFIAQRTDAVDELIYFPLAILTLGVLSRARVFDNWDFPLALGSLFIYGALYVLFKALQVQREAKKWKAELMDQLEAQRIYCNALGEEKEEGFLKLLIEDTQSFKKGAFMPLGDHPFYKALLLPFSGFGIMALLEYLYLAV